MERSFEPFLISAIENANDAVIVFDYEPGERPFRIRYVNPMFARQTGYGAEEAIGRNADLLHGPATDRAELERAIQSLLLKLPTVLTTLRYRKDGSTFWAEVNIRPLTGDDGRLLGAVAIQRDVTERMKAQQELVLLSTAMDQASDGMVIFEWNEATNQWRVAYANEMFLRLTGYRRDEIIGWSSDFLVGPETDLETVYAWRAELLAGEPVRGEIALYRSDGTRFWAELNGRPLLNDEGRIAHNIVVYRDVTDTHERQLRLTYEASHDPLTGVQNRRAFERTLTEAIGSVRTGGLTHGLLYFDLDGFKPVNDRYGHEAGDGMLVQLARAVGSKLRRVDAFARIGGDEFAILLRGCPPQRSEAIAKEILDAISGTIIVWNGQALRVGASIGVTTIDAGSDSAAEALRRADEACYEAKRGGRNRVFVAS
ncbi:MAG: diguanylate cyclase [Candidatus Eremiobacteraeota bacterium]|nr:diguanylate cyclase [Candidatus Eremiobacteraeota bacterium]MBV8435686.1 diguanylate cyclase [Candidatus Eremiobacteraeota bacterium]